MGRSRAQRGWALTGSIVLAVLCSLLAMSAGGNYGGRHSTFPVGIQMLAYLGLWIMVGVSVMLVWRHRWPLLVSILAIGGALVIPSTPLPALIACAAVCAVRRGRLRWLLIGGTYAVTVVALCWDLASSISLLSSFVGEPAADTPARLSLYWAVPVLAAAAVAPFAGFGILRGIRQERDAAQLGTAAATRSVAILRQEVERERERQDLARELHDTLAARLSSLSLHAGALELTVEGKDDATLAAARVVRETAQSSLDELRNVVHVLRNPAAAVPSSGLADIPALIDEAIEEGMDVHVRFLLSDPASCDPQVAHACYRLVQESLSNIRRHAPGVSARLEVRGGPETGVTITVANWLSSDARPSTTGGGHGLQGMSERVALAGGTFRAGPTPDGTFAVAAWLPWAPNRG
jgi:signal transduction histidine kinase